MKVARGTLLMLAVTLMVIGLTACKDPEDQEEEPMTYFESVELVTENPKAYEKVEFVLHEPEPIIESEGNPYDSRYLFVRGVFTSPSGEILTIPAFWTKDYNFTLDETWAGIPTGISGRASTNPDEVQGMEYVELLGDGHYRLRYLPKESGRHTFRVETLKDGVIVQIKQGSVDINPGTEDYHGVIKIEETHRRNFVYEDGTTFIPVGQNLGWYTSSTRQTEDYRVWFAKMQENYANFTRIWMGTWSFALHWGEAHDNFSSRLNMAARLDKVLDLAVLYDINVMLALLNHGQFSANVNPQWALNPWNEANGGPLAYPSQFFTNFEAKETYKQQLLYIIGRYGYAKSIMAWELFNEVDWTDNFSSTAVYIWHTEMSQFIKEHDPYHRLVTTSYKGSTGGAYQSIHIDFANPHSYDYGSKNIMTSLTPVIDSLHSQYNKPILQSEIGINWQNGRDTTTADPTGISLKQAQWAGVMNGSAGAAMNWWWDSWVHPNNLYHRFIGIGKFSRLMDMTGSNYDLLHKLEGVDVTRSQVGILGYRIDNRVYGYLYDTLWRHNMTTVYDKTTSVVIPLSNGSYTLELYDTDTGDLIESRSLTAVSGSVTFTVTLGEDKAFIIKGA
ncbi:MAG: hypothetical protein K9K93_02400 [Acholeplasmataceae bacterium]|nr:hypothetical protein [Acholeplasmataceae bacterium]